MGKQIKREFKTNHFYYTSADKSLLKNQLSTPYFVSRVAGVTESHKRKNNLSLLLNCMSESVP